MKPRLRNLGFFHELRHGLRDGPSLRAARRDRPGDHEPEVPAYLRMGAPFAVTGSLVSDILSNDPQPVAPLATLTDGVWTWPADLAYYVETYHVELPREFLEHAASNAWTPPKLTNAELVELSERAFAAD